MRAIIVIAAVALSTATAAGQAVYVGPQIALLGPGVSAEVDFGLLSGSAEVGWIPVNSVTYEQSGTEYRMDASTVSGLVMLNISAGESPFSFGAGVFFGGWNGDGEAVELGGSVDVGDNTYSAAVVQNMIVEFEFGGVSPAVMLGMRGKGFNFGIGAAFTGKPAYTMRATGSIQNDPQFQADLVDELVDIKDVLDKIPVMPLLRFGWQIGVMD